MGVAPAVRHALSSSDEPDRAIPWQAALEQALPPFRPATLTLRDSGFRFQLSSLPALFARRFELAVTFGVYLGLAAFASLRLCARKSQRRQKRLAR